MLERRPLNFLMNHLLEVKTRCDSYRRIKRSCHGQESLLSTEWRTKFLVLRRRFIQGESELVQIARCQAFGINLVIYGRVIDARVNEKSDEIGIVRKLNSFTSSKIEIRVFELIQQRSLQSNS